MFSGMHKLQGGGDASLLLGVAALSVCATAVLDVLC